MRIGIVSRFGFLGLAGLVGSLATAQNKPVVVPTLREEAAKYGHVHKSLIVDYTGCCVDFDELAQKSGLIIRGRVADEKARLSDDEMELWTDYTIEIMEVYKQAGNEFAPGTRLIVPKKGGHILIDGHPVQVDDAKFPPLNHDAPQILFLDRYISPSRYLFAFMPDDAAVSLHDGKVTCSLGWQTTSGVLGGCKGYCAMAADSFVTILKQKIATPGGGTPSTPSR